MDIVYEKFAGDFDGIMRVENECFTDPWTLGMFKESIDSEYTYFLTAKDLGKICGYILASVIGPEAEVLSIATAKEYRGKGIGKEMMRRFLCSFEMRDTEAVYLEVRVSNESAISLYKKFGFKALGIRRNYYRLPKEDALVMALYRNPKEDN